VRQRREVRSTRRRRLATVARSLLASTTLVAVTALLIVWQQSAAAAAVACIPPSWTFGQLPSEEITVPAEGAIPIPVFFDPGIDSMTAEDALPFVQVQVTSNATGTPVEVPGSLTYDADAQLVVWWPDAPPAADDVLTVDVTLDNEGLQANAVCGGFGTNTSATIMARVSSETTPAVPAPELQGQLTESAQPVQACCETQSCTGRGCDMCWTDGYRYPPALAIDVPDAAAAQISPFVWYEALRIAPDGSAASASQTPAGTAPTTLTVVFPEREADDGEMFCARVVAHSVLDGSTATSDDICIDGSALEPVDRIEVMRPDLSACVGPVTGGLPRSSEDDCGCTIRSGRRVPWTAATVFLALGLLSLVRRAGRRTG